MTYKKIFFTPLLFVGISSCYSAVTYIDATTANTTFNGEVLVLDTNYTSSPHGGPNNDDQWHLRTSLDTNGADAWTTGATNSEVKEGANLHPLATTFDLPGEGKYHIFGYFWIGGNGSAAWETEFELGGTGGTAITYTNANATSISLLPGASTYFTGGSVAYDAAYDMFEASLGVWDTSVDGLTVTVYADNGSGAAGADRRTRYDGVGYSVVPESATYALLGGLCAMSTVVFFRRKVVG